MAYRIILRRDTASNWTSNNPVLLAGEPGYETDTGKMKMGDGESTWNNLEYFVINPTGVTGATGSAGATGPGVDLLSVASHIIPATGGVYDLGATAGYEWRDLYLSGNSIYLGGVKIASDGTNVNMNSMIIGGPTGQGGVLLSSEGGVVLANGQPIGSAGIIDIEYADLALGATSGTLIPGSYYRITDFRTCYDQPDFDYLGNTITTGNYKQAEIQPIIVFATSESNISVDAYQPNYPNDKIKYDLFWSQTEVTGGTAYGRISERIDRFNNRTDYDHRTILFKRYRLYTHRQDQPMNGTVELFSDGSVVGTGTEFTLLNPGDVIYVPDVNPNYYEVTAITDNFNMGITGDIVGAPGATGSGLVFYKAIEENNGNNDDYFSFKRTNVKTNDFQEYTTFGDALSANFAKNNYIGNYANSIENDFILANNVFLEGGYESNRFGDHCYNNTFGTDNSNNVWGDYCYENVSTNDIDDNIIGHYFYRNLINTNLTANQIGNNFYSNRLLSENNESFSDNIIANEFNNNLIYSWFYRNRISDFFSENIIGDYRNLNNFEFYSNSIGSNFNSNIIRQGFQNNTIANGFVGNILNGYFSSNNIGFDFSSNVNIGHDFTDNQIGNNANGNQTIGDSFYNNLIGNGFSNNRISIRFRDNVINNSFQTNTFGQVQYFNWEDTSIENLTNRTYETLQDSLDGVIGNVILGKELIMHDTINNEYHKVKFTQWTQSGNGGGFSYERTKIYPTQEPTVYFTKTNYGSEVDIIVEGSLEITRGNNGGIYNRVEESNWNGSESPLGTEWNSIYTQSINGENFQDNQIGNYFGSNFIDNDFRHNKIGNQFDNNIIGDGFGFGYNTSQGNVIGNYFYDNIVGEYFYNNTIADGFYNNQIYDYFQLNNIKCPVYGVDFTQYYGNITGFNYVANGSSASDGTYTGLTGSSDGIGINATFDVMVNSGSVTSVTLDNSGKYYTINETVTISGTQIGGSNIIDDIVIGVTGISPLPTVYEGFNSDIFENSGNSSRLSYYNSSDVLTVKNIQE